MKALPIDIRWHEGLPVFASESFLKAVSNEYGWLGGFNDSGQLLCILPYTIIKKLSFKFVRFRVETIRQVEYFSIDEEKAFLDSCLDFFRSKKADVIIPATTNSIFRTYPDGAVAAPYGTYIIDLQPAEEVLWHNIERITRQNIKRAISLGVTVRETKEESPAAYELIRETFKRSSLPFMSFNAFQKYLDGLGQHGLILKAEHQGLAQSYVVFAYSQYRAYAVYAGNSADMMQGANKLLYWEAIKLFKELGVKDYDFVGVRINPEKGSKQDALSSFKRHFGGQLVQGYIWKYPLNPVQYKLYNLAARFRSGGDIVDAERHKMADLKS
jgi:lipid II:glycine glycyltransferase (peptidoglycan interpeptide bridge formation enzyme)